MDQDLLTTNARPASTPGRWATALFPVLSVLPVMAAGPAPAPQPAALVVVDAQVGVLGGVQAPDRLVAHLKALVARAREQGAPVVWVQHSDDELVYGSPGWQLVPALVPAAGEPVVHKRFNSSFARTDLQALLEARGVRRVVLAGAATNWCIRATAYAAMDRGYDLTVVGDAHSTEDLRLRDGRVVPAASIIDEFNAVIRWTSAPGVRVQVQDAADVDFRAGDVPAR